APAMPGLRVLGQIANTYVIAEGPDGMYLIDQHAAHESVLFYRLLRHWEERAAEQQALLEPLPVDLTPEQAEAATTARAKLARFGFALEPFGGRAWLIRGVPVMARQAPPGRLVAELLDGMHGASPAGTPTHWAMAASIACHSAIRAGQALSRQEMEALVDALSRDANPQHCPHGRPTTVRVTTAMLEREFGRA
ncbi:MAG: DNA mismatch repair protein MutL, partial [SAR202 cluster bacterium]|nr:DNA mismatch repair protein MutL [SAR202 cluster bacterium]